LQTIIRWVLCSTIPYSHGDARLFGSCATGLALPDSDIDFAIVGVQVYNRAQLFAVM